MGRSFCVGQGHGSRPLSSLWSAGGRPAQVSPAVPGVPAGAAPRRARLVQCAAPVGEEEAVRERGLSPGPSGSGSGPVGPPGPRRGRSQPDGSGRAPRHAAVACLLLDGVPATGQSTPPTAGTHRGGAQGARAGQGSGGAAGAARSWRLRKSCRARRFWKSMSASVMAAFQQLSPAQRKSISLRSVVTMVK